jgi:DNA-binding GntR family transcriptional regulator
VINGSGPWAERLNGLRMGRPSLQNASKPFQTKQEWVYATLKDGIQTGTLAPGQRLTLDDLADQLNVSRVPVREALLQLQVEGLVDMEPHMGAVVAPLSPDSVFEVFLVLEELEVLAGKIVAERSCDDDLDGLAAILDEMESAVREGDAEHWAEMNAEFHSEVSRQTAMPFLQQITGQALERWDRLRRFYRSEVLGVRLDRAQRDHRQIFAALKAGNGEKAEEILRRHNKKALQAYLARLSDEDRAQLASLGRPDQAAAGP